MKHLLIVAYYFPPIGGIASIRLARFAEILPELGWETTVLAPRDTPHAADGRLGFSESRVVRSTSIELSRLGRIGMGARAGRGSVATDAATPRQRLRRFAHRYLFFPDGQVGWYPGALLAGRRVLRMQRFDAVLSSSDPITAHLIARRLARIAGIPWVAEFRDPWVDLLPADAPHRRRAAAVERALASAATRVAMPTRTWADHYGRLWERNVDVLPNGFDDCLTAAPTPESPTLTHIGTYYPGRQRMTALWTAIARARDVDPRFAPRIRFVGEIPNKLREELRSSGIGDLVDVTGFVPHDEAVRHMANSTALVASGIGGDSAAERGWVPAKLFEYLATDLPILFVGDPSTEAAQLVAGYPGGFVADPGDAGAVAEGLRSALMAPRRTRDARSLTRRARTEELAAILDAATTVR
jgi:glycosyltransferase involved in cell wall biosynthesis